MTVKNYVTDIACPKCGADILEQLRNHYSESGGDFTTQCSNCETLLDIFVEPVPAFSIELHAARTHRPAYDDERESVLTDDNTAAK